MISTFWPFKKRRQSSALLEAMKEAMAREDYDKAMAIFESLSIEATALIDGAIEDVIRIDRILKEVIKEGQDAH